MTTGKRLRAGTFTNHNHLETIRVTPMPEEFPDTDALLTPREVAELFGVRTTTIVRWAREGTLTPLRTPGGHRRYRAGGRAPASLRGRVGLRATRAH
jgi:excisionase family DNA binding protein